MTTDTREIALLPCPFCGSDARFGEFGNSDHPGYTRYFVECAVCGTSTCVGRASKDKRIAAGSWNRRTDTTAREEGRKQGHEEAAKALEVLAGEVKVSGCAGESLGEYRGRVERAKRPFIEGAAKIRGLP